MTTQESFKRRIRARMAHTGERYGAARRALIEQAARRDGASEPRGSRRWVSPPEMDDEAVRAATGRGWDDWCDLLDAWPGRDDGHTAIAAHVRDDLGVDGWWAQTVTVGYERITGRRLPHQMADGTFTAGKARTVRVDPEALRSMLLDEQGRRDLFPGLDVELRSKPTAKTLRFAMDQGVAQVAVEPRGDGRATIHVAHERLPSASDVTVWKDYWADWLEALDDA